MGVGRAELEAAIRANRDDGALYDVYADWLVAHGDPLGELVALERRGDPSLQSRIAALRAELERWPDAAEYWPRGDFTTTWRWGLWSTISIACSTGNTDGRIDVPEFAEFAFAHPACVALRELHFDLHDWRFWTEIDVPPVLAAAEGHAWARDLDTLRVGEVRTASRHLGSLVRRCGEALSRIFPGLHVLELFAGELDIAGLALPNLRELHVVTGDLSAALLAEVLAADLPSLEQLELDADLDPDPRVDQPLAPAELAAIVDGRFPRLRSLTVSCAGAADELARALASSPIASQLEHLDVAVGDDAARALERAYFPRLQSRMIRRDGQADYDL